MRKTSKPFMLVLALALAVSLGACGGTSSQPAASSAGTENNPSQASSQAAPADPTEKKDAYVVGISQLVTHPALDAATEGFQDALNKWLPGQVTFDYQNAANDPATCATIANSFVSKNVDLIMANATPALQAAATATADIPILGTSVTEYGVAFGITDFSGTVGGNSSGTSDLAPLDQQAAMIK